MDIGDPTKGPALDHPVKLIFKELDPLLSRELCRGFNDPLHDTFWVSFGSIISYMVTL
jgi:hypothetical protein